MSDMRLIERWLPIAYIGIESTRERTPMTPFPAPNRLHVWWARRPLVASRAAVLASLLPGDADKGKFLHAIGIHGDPVKAKKRIAVASRKGERLGAGAYGYSRAFGYSLKSQDWNWLAKEGLNEKYVLDPTAGGGSIPFETVRVGLKALSNDLNPVAAIIQIATVGWPAKYGMKIKTLFEQVGEEFSQEVRKRLIGSYPKEPTKNARPDGYLWAHTVICPYCDGLVPLSPHWRLTKDGTGVRIIPNHGNGPGSNGRICSFEIVDSSKDQSKETVLRGDGNCPFTDCGRVIEGEEIKRQAQAGEMGRQLYAIVYKERIENILKSGKRGKDKWKRRFRAPRLEDDNSADIEKILDKKMLEWEALNIIPNEKFPQDGNDDRPIQYGMNLWRDLFSPRQLLCHGTSVEVFREMLDADRTDGKLSSIRKAAYVYLAISLDKLLSYNSRMSSWHANREVVTSAFDRHDYAFKWSHSEMAPLIEGLGYDWAIRETAKCIGELVRMINPESNELFDQEGHRKIPPLPITVTCNSADSLDHIEDASVDAIVMDPPYYDNVMYAELSDFFYVWMKRTAGYVFPEFFRRKLTDKDNEAVANPAKFHGQKGARMLAGRDYQERMASIFAECRRTLNPAGIMTLMFTHKAVGAWDALTKGLMEAGFTITASWPVKTEAEGSLHIRNKAAANSTIFLVCRPRADGAGKLNYWEDVEPLVKKSVRNRMKEFQDAGISGVDLYLASFGPALGQFSRHWPLKRGTPRDLPTKRRRRRQLELLEEEYDPYAVSPEDALDTARREVKRWRLEQLTHRKADVDLDPVTAFFVLAWDAFGAPRFLYDEALRLARAVGVDIDKDIVGRVAEKKGSEVRLWDSSERAAKGMLGPLDGSKAMIDPIHHAAHIARDRSIHAAEGELAKAQIDKDQRFFIALESVLEVLPVPKNFSKVELGVDAVASGNDFEALYNLSRLAYSDKVDEPEQLKLWKEDAA